ncbi:retropepsin-like aspartic protease family protein [Primorskyibacter sedentarius]|uniref:retropepsin-like aspartic protease family protein n=1 Tax=Primorskyibacter sedentarius TaxID=745311 RepID=UPI003EBCD9C2
MSNLDYGSLIYLVLLGGVLVFWFFVQNRQNLTRKVQQLAAWGFIFLGTIAAVGLWDDIRQTALPAQMVFENEGRIELPRAPDGHYYMMLEINGAPIRFMVDTGASGMVLTRQDAEKAGIDPSKLPYFSQAMTANGPVQTAPVRLREVRLGDITDTGFQAYVNSGEMQQSLLGMSYLQRFERLEITRGQMVLVR